MSDIQYTKLSSALIQDKKSLVISECSKGGYTLAQQLTFIDEDGKKQNLYLKGAFHIGSEDGLRNLRDALNVAIEKIEKSKK